MADYASARDVFDAVDRLEADVAGRLTALGEALAAARSFVVSVLADHRRHREARDRLRRRLRLPGVEAVVVHAADDHSLAGLRAAQEALVFAHAEGLPALGDPRAVDEMARHLVDLSRHLTVIDLWVESEEERG
jgi:hypothetical protein